MLMPLRLIYTWYPSLARSSEDASSVVQRLILNWLLRLELRVFLRIRQGSCDGCCQFLIFSGPA